MLQAVAEHLRGLMDAREVSLEFEGMTGALEAFANFLPEVFLSDLPNLKRVFDLLIFEVQSFLSELKLLTSRIQTGTKLACDSSDPNNSVVCLWVTHRQLEAYGLENCWWLTGNHVAMPNGIVM